MEKNILQQLSLTENEALIYETLLQNGKQKASQIQKKTPLKRGLIYKNLENLEKKGLIVREDNNQKVSTFTPIHPNVLKGLAEQQVKQAQEAQNLLQDELGSLVSMYNLANNKPGVEFYEGLDGIKKVIYDTLTSKTTIYTYADMEQINKYIKKLNAEYATKRDGLDLQKKVLLVDSAFTHTFLKEYKKTNLYVRFVKNVPHFATIMQIYDNKVSYVTLSTEKMIGIIIQDKSIYEMHKALFKNMWDNAK
jgi:sugar-specific transcriptional regulator TrmB